MATTADKVTTTKEGQIRQGDLLICPIKKLPDIKLREREDGVMAYGESSGHTHRVAGGQVLERESTGTTPPEGPLVWLVIPESPATLLHEDHGLKLVNGVKTQPIAPGTYEVLPARQYDPYEDTVRRVED